MGAAGEKGIDVWLALEAFEMAIYKRFDVIALVASDGDFLPLIRKLNAIGTRVMLLGWDFKFIDQNEQIRETRTSQALLNEVTYPLMMHQIIDDRSHRDEQVINGIFVPSKELHSRETLSAHSNKEKDVALGNKLEGIIHSLKDGYGFIKPKCGRTTIFFHNSQVLNVDFSELNAGDRVNFVPGTNEKRDCAIAVELSV